MRFSRLALIFTFAIALLLPSLASADGITWSFQNASFNDGGSISGNFNYNATTSTFSAININTTKGSSLAANSYSTLTYLLFSGSSFLGVGPNPPMGGSLAGDSFLELFFTNPLTNAGGQDSVYALELSCKDAGCSSFSSRYVLSGNVVSVSPRVPEPATLLLLAAGLFGLLLIRTRL